MSILASLAFMRAASPVILLLLAGCVAIEPEPPMSASTPCNGDGPHMWGALDKRTAGNPGLETDPRQAWRTVALMRGHPGFGWLTEAGNATLEWFGNSTSRLAIVSQQPPAAYLDLTVSYDGVDCRRFPAPDWNVQEPRQGALAEVGKGVLVHTAGFWENGTLFYTNMHEIHAGVSYGVDAEPAWPRAGWYAYAGDEPLQVYVYDQHRSEIPPTWGGSGGMPIPGEVTSNVPGRYFTTIPGFNAALKGLSTSTVTAVRIAPEDAYTWPGNEAHPLYGDALVFLISVQAVADQPCPAPDNREPAAPCFRT